MHATVHTSKICIPSYNMQPSLQVAQDNKVQFLHSEQEHQIITFVYKKVQKKSAPAHANAATSGQQHSA